MFTNPTNQRVANYLNYQTKKKDLPHPDITIRDIVVYPIALKDVWGEAPKKHNIFNGNLYSQKFTSIVRLIDHIQLLAHIANVYHQHAYLEKISDDDVWQVKKGCSSKITRLPTHEFSLYTHTILTLDEFSLLVQAIEQIAKNQHTNVHLFLSSFAIKSFAGELLNISLYVQCGPDPVIEVITKNKKSKVDFAYDNCPILFTSPKKGKIKVNDEIKEIDCLQTFLATKDGSTVIAMKSFFTVPVHRDEYLQVIEICFEHEEAKAKSLLKDACSNTKNTQIMPALVNHLVSSCTIPLDDENQISLADIRQIDPKEAKAEAKENATWHDDLTADDFFLPILNKYPQTLIGKNTKGLIIHHPPFGGSIHVFPQEEQSLLSYHPDLLPAVNRYNQAADKRKLIAHCQFNSSEDCLKDYEAVTLLLDDLFKTLNEYCIINNWDKLFKTASYYIKLNAQDMLAEIHATFLALMAVPEHLVAQAKAFLVDSKLKLEHLNERKPSRLVTDLSLEIENTLAQLTVTPSMVQKI